MTRQPASSGPHFCRDCTHLQAGVCGNRKSAWYDIRVTRGHYCSRYKRRMQKEAPKEVTSATS